MPAKVGYLVIDSVDPDQLAAFWCRLLEVEVDATIGAGEFLLLSPTADGLPVGFQRVSEAKAGKNRLYLDLVVDDLDGSTAEIEDLGGRWLEPGTTRDLEGSRWRCMADPDGNEFDIDTLPPGWSSPAASLLAGRPGSTTFPFRRNGNDAGHYRMANGA